MKCYNLSIKDKQSTLHVYIALSLVASALNYFAYPILGRILPNIEYVNITLSLSLLTQMTTFLSSIIAVTIGITKSFGSSDIASTLQIKLLKIFSFVGVAFLLLSPIIMNALRTPVYYALPILLMILASVPITTISGHLNSKNLLVKLGLTSLIVATIQFCLATLSAALFHSGVIVISAMVVAQILSLLIVTRIFKSDGLPSMQSTVKTAKKPRDINGILKFTIIASFAIMAVSLLQIFDLFIIQQDNPINVKFYTDVYIVSRAIYFFGIILIWPFLGKIDVINLRNNINPLVRLMLLFGAILIVSTLAMYLFGHQFTYILFGHQYTSYDIGMVSMLSIMFKVFFLVTTAICLYFVVLRSYLSLLVAIVASVSILYSLYIPTDKSLIGTLTPLVVASGFTALVSLILALKAMLQVKVDKNRSTPKKDLLSYDKI